MESTISVLWVAPAVVVVAVPFPLVPVRRSRMRAVERANELKFTTTVRHEATGAPPTTLTIARERPWRWRESNRASPIGRNPGQWHSFDSSCGDGGTEWYALVSVGTRWYALVRAVAAPTVSDPCPDARPHSKVRVTANSECRPAPRGAPLRLHDWGTPSSGIDIATGPAGACPPWRPAGAHTVVACISSSGRSRSRTGRHRPRRERWRGRPGRPELPRSGGH